MKYKILLPILIMVASFSAQAQSDEKVVSGEMIVGGKPLELIFAVRPEKSVLTVPAQYVFEMELSYAAFSGDSLLIRHDQMSMKYAGKVYGNIDSISGVYTQNGFSTPLTLFPKNDYKPVLRTQKLTPPYPYYTKDVTFKNKVEGFELAGTVTAPDSVGKFPAVILVTGSGPQDRDESLMGHKPFLVIADYLAKNGIAVLRYDDRGTAKSKGNFQSGKTLDFAMDASSAIDYLRTLPFVDTTKIGLIGHSEGGLIAPIAANENSNIKFIISLAGTGVNGREIIMEQTYLLAKAEKAEEKDLIIFRDLLKSCLDAILANPEFAAKQLDSAYKAFMAQLPEEEKTRLQKMDEFNKRGFFQFTTPWFLQFLTLEPVPYFEKLKVPVLGIWGSKDLQVPPTQNVPPIKKALEKAGVRHELEIFDSLNHLMQKSVTGGISEYATNETTIEPEVLARIVKFIKSF